MTEGRRTLRFQTADEIMPDVERLLAGYRHVGHWSLGQICNHLATSMRRVIDMPASTPQDPSQWVSEARKQEVFASGMLPEGIPAPPQALPPQATDEKAEAENLRQAIAYFQASPGPVVPHRVFGPLSREEWERLQLIHCAHHLSFVIPTS
ncbi:MAG TPA: DUF1569 domain-containing protein [Isosphaeraceae bacterium]|nr:DUF1569 domain-containing protein [Isosphaeraceae bacterium]